MHTKRERPSPDQWAKLDTALQGLRDQPPAHLSPSLGREIEKRADVIHTLLQSGWRIRDLAVFFKETAGITVSATTIQTALRQTRDNAESETAKSRAKRPRKRSRPNISFETMRTPATSHPTRQASTTEAQLPNGNANDSSGLGSMLTQGARKRGER